MTDAAARAGRPVRVLISDGETRPALAATRSLAANGYVVEVLAHSRFTRAGASRHASAVHAVPDASQDPMGWARAVQALLDREPNQLLFPVTEVALGSLFAADLDQRSDTLTPDRTAYQAMTDKAALVERAESLGIDVPKSAFYSDPKTYSGLPEGFSYPVVLKPRTSRWLTDGRWQSGDVCIIQSDAEGLSAAAKPGMAGGFLLQEYVPGHGESICLLTENGRSRASFSHKRLREKPPSGGVSVLSESQRPDPELLAASEKLLESARWEGIAMVEFRRTPEGRAALMEVNPRLWGSLQLAIDAGVDFPSLALAIRAGESFSEPIVQAGRKLRWLLGDFDHLWMVLLRPPAHKGLPPRRLRAIRRFFASFFDTSKLEVARLRDLRPFFADVFSWLR